eukprot:23633-Pyramimonas_sp.AAC.1
MYIPTCIRARIHAYLYASGHKEHWAVVATAATLELLKAAMTATAATDLCSGYNARAARDLVSLNIYP